MDKNHVISLIKQEFPDIDWNKFEDADRALNWELWHGPLPSEYWTEVEPLEYYVWNGWENAANDIIEILDGLPQVIYYEDGSDCILLENPDNVRDFWDDETYEYVGPEFFEVNVREVLMFVETYRQVHF